jgi:hypothetical protein
MMETVQDGLRAMEVEFHSPGTHRERLAEVGFVKIGKQRWKVPVGSWPKDPKLKEVGKYALVAAEMGVEDVMLAPLSRTLGWSREEIQVLAASVRKDLRERSVHAYVWAYAFWAQKPH